MEIAVAIFVMCVVWVLIHDHRKTRAFLRPMEEELAAKQAELDRARAELGWQND